MVFRALKHGQGQPRESGETKSSLSQTHDFSCPHIIQRQYRRRGKENKEKTRVWNRGVQNQNQYQSILRPRPPVLPFLFFRLFLLMLLLLVVLRVSYSAVRMFRWCISIGNSRTRQIRRQVPKI